MKTRIALFVVFALLFLAQLAVPIGLVYDSEKALSDGDLIKFRCDFYDPKDLFRGNYMRINLAEISAEYHGGVKSIDSKPVDGKTGRGMVYIKENLYVTFEQDPDGFARVSDFSDQKPDGNYLVSTDSRYNRSSNKIVFGNFGMDKFFVNEKDAPLAEAAVAGLGRDDEVYLLAAVKSGRYAVKDLVVNGKSILDLVSETKNSAEK